MSTGIAAIVVQLGLAMMPFGRLRASAKLTSETTSGTWSSLRHADELSITVTPAAANRGAWTRDIVAPAENTAMSRPVGSAVSASSTSISWPRNGSLRPCERADAKNRTLVAGKSRSSSNLRITWPTWPVAPTIPIDNPVAPNLTSCPRIHRGLLGAAEAECLV